MTESKLRRTDGFTLIEVMVAVAISLITLGAVFAFFVAQDKIAKSQRELGQAQQNARIASELLARDLRSAGYNINDVSSALRVEQSCIKNPYTPAGFADACPNGSDRVTLHFRAQGAMMFGCGGEGSTSQVCNRGGVHMIFFEPNQICPDGGQPTVSGGCTAPSQHPNGLACGDSYAAGEKQVSICAPDSGFPCVTLDVKKIDCDKPCTNGGASPNGCTNVQFHNCAPNCPLNCNSLPALLGGGNCGGKPVPEFRKGGMGNEFFRTYQLIDLDGDGTTELAYTDAAIGAASMAPADFRDTWVVVAPYIDDFQVAVNANNGVSPPATVPAATPDQPLDQCGGTDDPNCDTFWFSRNIMWGVEDADLDGQTDLTDYQAFNGNKDYNATTAFNACSDNGAGAQETNVANDRVGCPGTMRALRFTVVARAPHRVLDPDGTTMYPSRNYPIEDNQPAPVYGPTPPAAVPTGPAPAGCGSTASAAAFGRCTLSGNEPGYPRRILTTTIIMRNMQGLNPD